MNSFWSALFDQASLAVPLGEARRVANFVFAAALADEGKTVVLSPAQLAEQTQFMAAQLGCSLAFGSLDWAEVAQLLQGCPTVAVGPRELDAWVEAFQAADGSRKSLGAFATPAPFADALAEALLGQSSVREGFRVVDPSVGAGSLLAAVYRALVDRGLSPAAAVRTLHGVEIDPAARELCVLQLWLSTPSPRPPITDIAGRIVVSNALTRDWWSDEPLFDAVIMNPPWESLRHSAASAAVERERLMTLDRLGKPRSGAEGLPSLYSAHGRGDRNLFKAFVELAPHLLKPGGRLSALLPAAFGSDDGMSELRRLYLDHLSLERWTTYENRGRYFAIDSRYKFGLLSASRSDDGTSRLMIRSFSTHPREAKEEHIPIDVAELTSIGGPNKMIPEFTSEGERDILATMMTKGAPLFERGAFGRVSYRREVDLTMGRAAGRFVHVEETAALKGKLGFLAFDQAQEVVPVLEGRMVGQYDCFQKSYIGGSGRTAVWEQNDDRPLSHCRPQFVAPAKESSVGRVAICDVTSATNTRTVIATLVPRRWLCGNTAPVLQFETEDLALAGLAVLNSLTFDWMARRVISGLHLNKFYLACLRWPNVDPLVLKRLSELGRSIADVSPRGGLPGATSSPLSPLARVDALVEAEVLIAQAFELSWGEVSFMLNDCPTDRRGFWRYYSSAPEGREIRRRTLERLETVERLAA